MCLLYNTPRPQPLLPSSPPSSHLLTSSLPPTYPLFLHFQTKMAKQDAVKLGTNPHIKDRRGDPVGGKGCFYNIFPMSSDNNL